MIPFVPGFLLYCRQNLSIIHFAELLDLCINRAHECYQEAWYEFERRYRAIIFARIRAHLLRWSAANNREYVADISGKITERLLANECRALRTFKGRENEGKFISFLNVICQRTANSYMILQTQLNPALLEEITIPQEDKADLFDLYVETLRDKLADSQKSPLNIERDMFVFLLRFMAEFKSKDVAAIPLLKLSPHNVDIIVHRLCAILRDRKNKLSGR
jgi:hypothetical protein